MVFSQCFELSQNLINFDIYSDPGHIGKHLTALLYYFRIINYQLNGDLMKKKLEIHYDFLNILAFSLSFGLSQSFIDFEIRGESDLQGSILQLGLFFIKQSTINIIEI